MDFQCWFGSCSHTLRSFIFCFSHFSPLSLLLVIVICMGTASFTGCMSPSCPSEAVQLVNKNSHPICVSNIPPIFKCKIFSCLQMYTSSYCCFPHTRCCCGFNGVHKIFQKHTHCRWPHGALNEFRTGITSIKITYQQPLSPSVGGGWSRRHSPEPWLIIGNVQKLRIPS